MSATGDHYPALKDARKTINDIQAEVLSYLDENYSGYDMDKDEYPNDHVRALVRIYKRAEEHYDKRDY